MPNALISIKQDLTWTDDNSCIKKFVNEMDYSSYCGNLGDSGYKKFIKQTCNDYVYMFQYLENGSVHGFALIRPQNDKGNGDNWKLELLCVKNGSIKGAGAWIMKKIISVAIGGRIMSISIVSILDRIVYYARLGFYTDCERVDHGELINKLQDCFKTNQSNCESIVVGFLGDRCNTCLVEGDLLPMKWTNTITSYQEYTNTGNKICSGRLGSCDMICNGCLFLDYPRKR